VPKAFIDTNVLFYAVDGRDPAKQEQAVTLLARLAKSGEGHVSVQVVNEFAVNLIKKLGLSPPDAARFCRGLRDFALVPTDHGTVDRALRLMDETSISYWDAAVVAAAEAVECRLLYSEDLNSGQSIAGIKIVNPFSA
jgi:predicted nucleic acid-binding protein